MGSWRNLVALLPLKEKVEGSNPSGLTMELLDTIKSIVYKPYGPEDYSSAEWLLNKEVLCAQQMLGLGSYATLKAIDPSPYGPYAVEHKWNPGTIVHYKWIVLNGR